MKIIVFINTINFPHNQESHINKLQKNAFYFVYFFTITIHGISNLVGCAQH